MEYKAGKEPSLLSPIKHLYTWETPIIRMLLRDACLKWLLSLYEKQMEVLNSLFLLTAKLKSQNFCDYQVFLTVDTDITDIFIILLILLIYSLYISIKFVSQTILFRIIKFKNRIQERKRKQMQNEKELVFFTIKNLPWLTHLK